MPGNLYFLNMDTGIHKAISHGYGNALIFTAVLTAAVTDLVPTPADALYFYDTDRLKNKLAAGKITPKQFWVKEAVGYYLYNPAWWLLFFGIMVAVGGDYKHKAKVGAAILGAGGVVTVIYKNIKKDNSLNQGI